MPRGNAAPNHQVSALPVVTFEAYLENYVCEILNKLPQVHEDTEVRIANISFGFDNTELIRMLTERGSLITKGKMDKVPELNEKIDAQAKDKRTDYIRPVAAFITFEKQEGKDRALKYFVDPNTAVEEEDDFDNQGDGTHLTQQRRELVAKVDKKLMDEELIMTQAPEPQEILWENRHITKKQQAFAKVIVSFMVIIFLLAMFVLFTWMKSKAIKNMWRYPSTVNCNSTDSIFMVDGVVDTAYYAEYAAVDSMLTSERQGTGIY